MRDVAPGDNHTTLPPVDSASAKRRLDEAIRAEPDPSAPRTGKFAVVRALLREVTAVAEEDVGAVFVGKPSNFDNRLGQQGTKHRQLAIVIVGWPERGDGESDEAFAGRKQRAHDNYVKRSKVVVGEEIVGSVLLCEQRDGGWTAVEFVEPQGGRLASVMRATFPAISTSTPTHEARADEKGSVPPPAEEGELADSLYLDREWVDDVIWMLQDKRALVLYGPPGTGKTFIAQKLASHVQADVTRRATVQLHPSYAYEDFFEGYRPVVVDGVASLVKQRGPLRELARIAGEHPKQPVVLILDEMNRGNLPRVFGELFFLLEYRDQSVSLMYSPEEFFRLPKNLFLICTMNTADRSIALLDQALRRRFHFAALFPDAPPVTEMLRRYLAENRPEMAWVADVLDEANRRIGDRNAQIGPSHFMRQDLDETSLRRIWRASILPSIEEHFFGQPSRLDDFHLERLINASRTAASDAAPAA